MMEHLNIEQDSKESLIYLMSTCFISVTTDREGFHP